jgi:VWFA-related protein
MKPQALAVSILLIASWLPAQPPAPKAMEPASGNQPAIPTLQANSHAVVVDIVVTKGKDEPIIALHKEQFQVLEDGKPQPIDFFEEHTAASAAPIPLAKMPPNVYTNVPAAPPGDSVNILLLDSLNTPGADQVYVRQQSLEFLKSMKPETRIAIFTLGTQLRFIQGFTGDPVALKAALNGDIFEFSPLPVGFSSTGRADSGGHGQDTLEPHDLGQHVRREEMSLEALRIMARYLAAIPGRKNLIWFASSYPVRFFPEKQPFNNTPEMNQEIKQTCDLLTLSRVALYPINGQGLMNDNWMDPGQSGSIRGADAGMSAGQTAGQSAGAGVGRGSTAGSALQRDVMGENAQRARTISAMEQLASDTGGEAIFNTNDLSAATARVMQNGSHYYTLVYTPANKIMDGKFRQIEIKLDAASPAERKYKLSYRRGYYADDDSKPEPKSQAAKDDKLNGTPSGISDSDPLRPLLVHGLPGATQLLYGVRVVPAATQPAASAKRAGSNDKLTVPTTRYTMDFLIDWKQVQLQITPQGNRTGRIQVSLIARDADGKALNWTGGTMILNLNPTTYAEIQKTGIRAHAELDLPRTNVFLATGIYDLAAHKAGTLEIPVAITAQAVPSAQTAPGSH